MTLDLREATYCIRGIVVHTRAVLTSENRAGKDIADAQYDGDVADDLSGGPIRHVDALNSQEADVRSQYDSSL